MLTMIFSGLIGRSWAMLFASVGYNVSIYDIDKNQITSALNDIEEQIKTLEAKKLLRGKLSASQQCSLIKGSNRSICSLCKEFAGYLEDILSSDAAE
jgi:L-gulonate 3-dehydrogenase